MTTVYLPYPVIMHTYSTVLYSIPPHTYSPVHYLILLSCIHIVQYCTVYPHTHTVQSITLSCSSIDSALCNGRIIHEPVVCAYTFASCRSDVISFMPLTNIKRSPLSLLRYYSRDKNG